MKYGASNIQQEMRNDLKGYIRTQYLGKTPILAENLEKELSQEGILYKEPYIESSPAYKTVAGGFNHAKLLDWEKDFLSELADRNLGVFKQPFEHQVEALEAFEEGKDVFISTGTGSGKTECFLWPLLVKLAKEAKDGKSWSKRGIRTIVMYPMNALVSDQITRLRNIIGKDEFAEIFSKLNSDTRRPQFGMYTGRTPYPGAKPKKQDDIDLAEKLKELITGDKQYTEKLRKEGRIPVKANLEEFINNLEKGKHITAADDAELITRFEMQETIPDILITNYSMLEYMLFRPREAKFWKETTAWLNEEKENKLLFVIDEAHMYKGSAGGEVAYLIRRFLHKLQIDRDKVQFILTTASMPQHHEEEILDFACNLTAANNRESFSMIRGVKEELPKDKLNDLPINKLLEINLEAFNQEDDVDILKQLNNLWGVDFENVEAAQNWLYENLYKYRPFNQLFTLCRGKAVSLGDIAKEIFPDENEDRAITATNVLLEIATLAKNNKGDVLFPARMHMLFRGIKGVYACCNPHCTRATKGGGITLGRLFVSQEIKRCPDCNSVVYELYSDRHCGALFYHGYIATDVQSELDKEYLWHNPGKITRGMTGTVKEVNLFIPYDGFNSRKIKGVAPCYLNIENGYVYFNEDYPGEKSSYLKLYYDTKAINNINNDSITFRKCPQCRKNLASGINNFDTRGNQAFYELVKSQFNAEPLVKKSAELPNQGRKVLLFSDSRQKAAKLALDMSETSQRAATRQLLALAIKYLNNESASINLDNIYGYYLKAIYEKGTRNILVDDDQKEYSKVVRKIDKGKTLDKKFKLDKASDFVKESILRLYCSPYNNYYDTAISWLEPTEDSLEDFIDNLEDEDIEISSNYKNYLKEVLTIWMMLICTNYMALGSSISDTLRLKIGEYADKGLKESELENLPGIIRGALKKVGVREDRIEDFIDTLKEDYLSKSHTGEWYLKLDAIKPCLDLEHTWYFCKKCLQVVPFNIDEKCPYCELGELHELSDKLLENLDYWRKPIIAVLISQNEKVSLIDTEEHTAQVSNKDVRKKYWSTSENYELRFQDILKDGEDSVDVLSSTTTMEVGIDIGSLVAIGLRNVPPTRENYQQRAGRAGRRGASLSTIVTFCENGPHDSLYFNDPVPMFEGDPRVPWIDVQSDKIIQRHLNLVILSEYLLAKGRSIDALKINDFIDGYYSDFLHYLDLWQVEKSSILLNEKFDEVPFKDNLKKDLRTIKEKLQNHPEIYNIDKHNSRRDVKKLLDVVYEEGTIPSYSFPKNVVSAYLGDNEVDRSLDFAISEYAPGRTVVVDKKVYQIGGLRSSANADRSSTRKYLADSTHVKSVYSCDNCSWFGLEGDRVKAGDKCYFCGKGTISKSEKPMIRPWGFAPKNGTQLSSSNVKEEVTFAQEPIYSTLPNNGKDIKVVNDYQHLKIANRKNQRIIMMNTGGNGRGFMLCKACGASMPGNDIKVLQNIQAPDKKSCSHPEMINVDLGYDFITDMLVLEFEFDSKKINTSYNNIWYHRAGVSLAEAIRLAAGKILDIDFSELVTGCRYRNDKQGCFLDVYLYDDLLSGAGYSNSLSKIIGQVLAEAEKILKQCNCDDACYNCLKHYRNQYVHGDLDRKAALELLAWGRDGEIATSIPQKQQLELLEPLHDILLERGLKLDNLKINNKEVVIYPSMRLPEKDGKIYLSEYLMKYALPLAVQEINSNF